MKRLHFFGWDGSVEIYLSDEDPVLWFHDKHRGITASVAPTAEDLDTLEACIQKLRGRRLPERDTD